MGERPEGNPRLVDGALDRGRRAASGLLEGFRRTGRWQKVRLGLVGGWIGASLLALWIACPSSGPGNSLGADVHVLKDSLLGGQQIVQALVALLERLAAAKHATPAQIALAWLLAQQPWIVPIPGTTKLARLDENLGALNVEFTPADLREIDVAAAQIPIAGARYPAAIEAMTGR